VYLYIMCRVGR